MKWQKDTQAKEENSILIIELCVSLWLNMGQNGIFRENVWLIRSSANRYFGLMN